MRLRSRRSVRSVRIGAALAVASGALVACNLITGLDADYSSSAYDAAKSPFGEGGGSDAPGSDGQGTDASNDGMAKVDAGDSGLTTWCRSVQDGSADNDFFCSDFENTSFTGQGQPPTGWTDLVNLRDAGSLSIVTANSSHVLDVTSSSNGTMAGGAHTRLGRVISGAPLGANAYLHYELDFDFCVLSSNLQYAGLGFLAFTTTDTQPKEHGIATYGPSAVILSHQGSSAALMKSLPDPGGWHHGRVTLDRAAADTSYMRKITIDDLDVDDSPSGQIVAAGDPTQLWLGVFYGAPATGQAHVQFDNFVFRRSQ